MRCAGGEGSSGLFIQAWINTIQVDDWTGQNRSQASGLLLIRNNIPINHLWSRAGEHFFFYYSTSKVRWSQLCIPIIVVSVSASIYIKKKTIQYCLVCMQLRWWEWISKQELKTGFPIFQLQSDKVSRAYDKSNNTLVDCDTTRECQIGICFWGMVSDPYFYTIIFAINVMVNQEHDNKRHRVLTAYDPKSFTNIIHLISILPIRVPIRPLMEQRCWSMTVPVFTLAVGTESLTGRRKGWFIKLKWRDRFSKC